MITLLYIWLALIIIGIIGAICWIFDLKKKLKNINIKLKNENEENQQTEARI